MFRYNSRVSKNQRIINISNNYTAFKQILKSPSPDSFIKVGRGGLNEKYTRKL